MSAARTLFRFDTPESVLEWVAINDGVMGGVSSSRLRYDSAGFAVFEGQVSLENRGGFASIRSPVRAPKNLDAVCCTMEVLSDGKSYKVNLRTDEAFDGLNYQASFAAPLNQWTLVKLPILSFSASFHGRSVPGAPMLDPTHVRQVGLLIADQQAGPFSLQIRTIDLEP